MISFFGLKRASVIGTKVWPNEPVPPVIRMVLFASMGRSQSSSMCRGGKVSQPRQPGHCQKWRWASKPQAAQR